MTKELQNKTVGFLGGKFLPLHLGHVYAIIDASNQVDELYVILSSSKKRDGELCKRGGIKYLPPELRLSWLGEVLRDLENVKIIHMQDNYGINDYNWEEGAEFVKKVINKPVNFTFSSEPEYGEKFNQLYPGSKHIVIDSDRKTIKISATELRRDLFENWVRLPGCVRAHFIKKVAVVGTESCGKTTLAKQLSKFYNADFVYEVGREYCERHKDKLTPEMFNLIAMEHFLLQKQKAKQGNKILFVDSEAVVTQYYLDMYFPGRKSSLIEEIIKLQDYDLILYLEPDIKWVDDGWRFAGEYEVRQSNNSKLKQMFSERGIQFFSISGTYKQRFDTARTIVSKLFEGGGAR